MVANILAGPLRELAPLIGVLPKAGGHLGLSGVLASRRKACEAYAERFALDAVAEKKSGVASLACAANRRMGQQLLARFRPPETCLKSPPAPFSCRFFTLKSVDCAVIALSLLTVRAHNIDISLSE